MPGDLEEIVARMLLFLYTGDYDDSIVQTAGFMDDLNSEALTANTSSTAATASPRPNFVAALERPGCLSQDPRTNIAHPRRGQRGAMSVRERIRRADLRKKLREQEQIVAALETNAQVYVCADKHLIDKLKNHAASKFKARLDSLADAKDAYPAIRFLYENIREDNTELCNEATQYCIDHYIRVEAFPEFIDLLETYEPRAWTFAVKLQRQRAKERGELEQKISDLEKDEKEAENLFNAFTSLFERIRSSFPNVRNPDPWSDR